MIGKHRKALEAVQASANPLLVFQMGKVASKSVVAALSEHAPNDVFHIHRMNPAAITVGREDTIRRTMDFVGLALFHHVIVPNRPAKIITMVRDPIARNLSAFFHRPQDEVSVSAFIENYAQWIPLRWFDTQFRPVTGIDVYEHAFDHERGWAIIEHALRPVLILRTETPDDIKAKTLADFTKLPVTQIPRANSGADKPYADAYRQFKERLKLPEDFVDSMLESRFTHHFYSDEERSAMRQLWAHNVIAGD